MSAQAVLLIFAVGAALLALWTDVRFPSLGPSGLADAVIRLVAALAVGYLVGAALGYAVGAGMAPAVALLTLALPALVLMFLAAVWIIRVLQDALYGLRH